MAVTPITIPGLPPGLTGATLDVTVDDVLLESDIAISAVDATTDVYTGTVTSAAAGVAFLQVRHSSGVVIDSRFSEIEDTTTAQTMREMGHLSAAIADIPTSSTVVVSAAAPALAAINSGGTLTIPIGTKVSFAFTGLGDLSDRAGKKLWFTAKSSKKRSDAEALVQWNEDAGLIIVNGETTGFASADVEIVIDDEANGDVTFTFKRGATNGLSEILDGYWDLRLIDGDDEPQVLTRGQFQATYTVGQSV